uniref:Rhabdovirus nucleocapsid domain-containing protein n=1 Tax=Tetranychus urticae TaxID=32264 RepID=T1KUS4_TETUR
MASSESINLLFNPDVNPEWREILKTFATGLSRGKLACKYPIEYFEKISLPSAKPPVSLPYKNVPLDTLRPVVVKSIKDGTISCDLAALFLWKYGERLKATVNEKWESFGVTICEPGEVRLSSIIDVHFGAQEILSSIETDGMVSSNDDNWIASFLTSIYRINCAKNENYRLELSKTASNIMVKNFGKGSYASLDFLNVTYRHWIGNTNYIKIIAAYDMFLFKTNIKKYQFLRWGTISSRYRECSVLSTLIDISNECGFTNLSDLRKWVFVDSIERDLNRVLKDGQEIDKLDSYTPYLHDLRLSSQSPYSCSYNPVLYEFLSTMGVYMGRKGSMNVKMLRGPYHERRSTCFNGLVVAYLLREKNCEPNKSTENSFVLIKSPILDTKEVRRELSDYIFDKGTGISGPLEEFKKSIDVTIVNPRPDTIGHYLKHCLK